MVKYLSLREIQMEEYRMLNEFDAILKKNNLRYVLCGGSLLGAIRHEGFIPWDDDIDVIMPREDYDKLRSLIKNDKIKTAPFRFMLPGSENYPYPFIKMINPNLIADEEFRDDSMKACLWIDVFPLDYLPSNHLLHHIYIYSNLVLKAFLYCGTVRDDYLKKRGRYRNVKERCKVYVAKSGYYLLGGYKNITVLMDKYAKLIGYLCKRSKYMGNGTWPVGMKDYYHISSWFPIDQHKFEKDNYCIPKNYDDNLRQLYGDYMKIPSESERVNHSISVYYLKRNEC